MDQSRPIAAEGGWNLYGFVDNEVVFSIDYLGKETNEFGYTMNILYELWLLD